MATPILKIFSHQGCQSYLLGCRDTQEAALIDPKVGMEEMYHYFLQAYGLKLKAVVDTHTHADHLSASSRLATGDVALYMSTNTQVQRERLSLAHGQTLRLGSLALEAHSVPGHTEDSLALVGEGMAFTGDSLLIGSLGRADFHGSNPEQLWQSVQRELMPLPQDTLVFPGHSYQDILFSTIGAEQEQNSALAFADAQSYAASLNIVEGAGNSPAVDQMLALNQEANPELPDVVGNAAACCAGGGGMAQQDIAELTTEEAYQAYSAMADATHWVDVRDPQEWAQGHIPNTTLISLSELGFHLKQLRQADPLYLCCRSGVRSVTAAKTLQRLGVQATPHSVAGGILGWQAHGFPIEGGVLA